MEGRGTPAWRSPHPKAIADVYGLSPRVLLSALASHGAEIYYIPLSACLSVPLVTTLWVSFHVSLAEGGNLKTEAPTSVMEIGSRAEGRCQEQGPRCSAG